MSFRDDLINGDTNDGRFLWHMMYKTLVRFELRGTLYVNKDTYYFKPR